MSLTRQLLLVVLLSLAAAILGATTVVVVSTRGDLQRRLDAQAAQIAQLAARGLVGVQIDPAGAERIATAAVAGGHVQHIVLADGSGRVLAEASGPKLESPVPEWFTAIAALRPAVASIGIADDGRPIGKVTVEAAGLPALAELWATARRISDALLVLGLISAALGVLVLRRQLAPLERVAEQADAILHNRFEPSGLRPSAPELRRVVEAMDRLVGRMKEQFEEEIARSERLRREALSDQVTGLPNRRWFDHHLQDVLAADDESAHGALLLLRVTDLDGRNRRHGYVRTDQWLRELAGALTALGRAREGWALARLRGADFVVLAPGVDAAGIATFGAGLITALASLADGDNSSPVRCGLTPYQRGDSPATLLAQADAALSAAEAAGTDWQLPPAVELADAAPGHDWAALLRTALQEERFVLYGQPALAADGSVLHHEVLARLPLADADEPLVAGTFVPIAARLGLAADLDRLIVLLALDQIDRERRPLAVNLSEAALRDRGFLDFFAIELGQRPALAPWLIFETREAYVLHDLDAATAFIAVLRELGCRFGLDHVGRSFAPAGYLARLGVEYLKLDGGFVRGVDREPVQRQYVEALCRSAHALGISVIAERVESETEAADLRALGFDGLQGRALAAPAPLGGA